jgi:hypothetical protein
MLAAAEGFGFRGLAKLRASERSNRIEYTKEPRLFECAMHSRR